MVRGNLKSSLKRSFCQIYFRCRNFQPLLFTILIFSLAFAQPAKNANKFLGNLTTNGQIRTDFTDYWDHLTGETECNWFAIEAVRNTMNWTGPDRVANFAREKKIPWRFHSLLTSGTYPNWLVSIPDTTLLKEIGQWMDEAAKRYPDVTMIDVINEGYKTHTFPGIFRKVLGGDGSTGFDWIITAFKMARERWPKAILIYNDYNNLEYETEISWTIDLIAALKKAGAPIDMIGCQANYASKLPTSTIKANIDRIAAAGLPVYISAYEIPESRDTLQDKIMREQFTMFWNHPKIIGITYWGYVVGSTWRTGTGLLTKEGVERSALTWLKNYVANNLNPPNDFPNLLKPGKPVDVINKPGMVPSNARSIQKADYSIVDMLGRAAGLNPLKIKNKTALSSGWYVNTQDGDPVIYRGNTTKDN